MRLAAWHSPKQLIFPYRTHVLVHCAGDRAIGLACMDGAFPGFPSHELRACRAAWPTNFHWPRRDNESSVGAVQSTTTALASVIAVRSG